MAEFFKTNAPPALTTSFTFSPSSPQADQQVTFTATASGGTSPYTFGWNFGDGTNGNGATTTHTYLNAGSFPVLLSTRDSGSPQQTATAQRSVTVTNPPPPTLTASFTYSPTSPQTGQQITFSASVSGGTSPYSFSWNFGDSQTATGSSVSHGYSTAGTFSVVLTVKDAGIPQQTSTSQHSITVTNPPTLTAGFTYNPSSPQAGQLVTFTASAGGGTAPYSYSWTLGDGSAATGSTVTHTYSSSGTFNIVLNVKDSGSTQQTTTSQRSVTVSSPAPSPPTSSFTYSPSSPNVGQTVSFSASASGGTLPYRYSWNFGDSSTGVGATVAHSYSSAGTFMVTLTVTDGGSPQQGSNSQHSLTVVSPPPALSAGFSYSPTSPQAGQTITFTGSASGGTTPYTYSWNFGDSSTGSGVSTTHTYQAAGKYSVVLSVRDAGGQTTSATQTITVANPPPALTTSFTYAPASPETGQQVSFTASASGGTSPYTFSWTFGDGSAASSNPTTNAYSSSGSFTVTVIATDANGLTASSSQTITAAATPAVSFTFTPATSEATSPVTFTAKTSGGRGSFAFSWIFGDGSAAGSTPATHT